MRYALLTLVCIVALSGCTSFRSMMDGLEAHKVKGCHRYTTNIGGGWGFTVNGVLYGIVATGGIDPALCFGVSTQREPGEL